MSETAAKQSAKEMILGYFRDFNVLKETKAEYWGIQVINFLDCTFYFAMLTIASVFLSEDLGLSDQSAGYAITVFTTTTTICLFFSGMITDWLGIKRSMYLTLSSLLVLRLAMVVIGLMPAIPHRGIIATALFFLMAPFMASIQTIFQSANKRFTSKRSRSAGFNLWYLFMNIGAALGGFLIDLVRKILHLPNTHIFTAGVICALLCIVASLLLVRNEKQLLGPNETEEEKTTEVEVKRKNPIQIAIEVVREKAFWRLLVLIALLLGTRAVFTYIYLLMPKYWLRVIGPDAAIGTLNMINPIGIVIGLILFIPLTNKFNIFSMLVYGSMVSAISLFPMALPWQYLGSDIANAHYLMAILCMIFLTIGEVIWSPKLSEYTAAIAPPGQEGTYLGLTMVPWFLAKTVVSVLSGHMLVRWSPEKVDIQGTLMPLQDAMKQNLLDYWHTPAAMWLILGLFAIGGSILAALLRGWLTQGARWNIQDGDAKLH
ncbi:MAG: MFS transporter [Myxococcales bacterium]|nr:MFS transporter [Myxococcales bacterium]